MTSADVTFAEFVAERILATPSRDVDGWCTAFGFYAGSRQWRGYVRRCVKYSEFNTPTAQRLADAVVKAFHSVPRLDEEEEKEDMLSLKRARSDPTSEQSLKYDTLRFSSNDRPSSSHDPISSLAYKVFDELGPDRRPEEILQRIEEEARALKVKSAKFARVTSEWVRIVQGFDAELREIGDFEGWIKAMEFDLNNLAGVMEDVAKQGAAPPSGTEGDER